MAPSMDRLASRPELARLQALAGVASAASGGGDIDATMNALVRGIREAFGLEVVLNIYDPKLDAFVVRAATGGASQLMGTWSRRQVFEELLDPVHELVPDVFFLPHEAEVDVGGLSAIHTPDHGWPGPGYWHPMDMCLVAMRTSQGKLLGVLSVDSEIDQRIPEPDSFELLRVFAMVGANALDNAMLMREVADLQAEREMRRLRQELQEEVLLRGSLLEIGSRLGAMSAAAPQDIFPIIAEHLAMVVPIKALTIWHVDAPNRKIRATYHSEEAIAEAVTGFDFPFGVGATGQAILLRESVVANAGGPEQFRIDVPGTPDDLEHILAVPVTTEEEVRVVLTLHRDASEPPFVPVDAHRATLFAQHAASAFLLMELAENRRQLSAQVESLEDINRLKDEFVASVSHELRTPITAIIGSVVTVAGLGDMLAAEERRELLVGAERQAKRLAELLENLLAESRLTSNDAELAPVRVDVGSFVDEVADTLRFRAPGREIRTRIDSKLEVVADRSLLYRTLFNLGDNAIKYSDGPVDLEAEPDGDGVRIDVVDNGIGIAREDIPQVFERFRQLDASDRRRVGGVGLGLHLCARAAEAMGGRIDVDSEVGRGSRFSLWLPKSGPAPA